MNFRLLAVAAILLMVISPVVMAAPCPQFTASGDSWVCTDGANVIRMWNATGKHLFLTTGNATSYAYNISAGGGGGGSGTAGAAYDGGGGGAGGFINGTITGLSGTVNVIVGAGGAGAAADGNAGSQGQNSSFGNTTAGNGANAKWGGGGYGHATAGGAGGGGSTGAGGAAFTGNFLAGGTGTGGSNTAGGGGGKVSAGGNGKALNTNGGEGGRGFNFYINGTFFPLSCGGGGSGLAAGGGGLAGNASGMPCGGVGGEATTPTAGGNAIAGTGSGGGGTSRKSVITAGNGASGIVFVTYALANPTPDFAANRTYGGIPLPTYFDSSLSSGGTLPRAGWGYNWTFGDGGTSTVPNATYTYVNAGVYTVSLTITAGGVNTTTTKVGYMQPGMSDVNFHATSTSGNPSSLFTFIDDSVVYDSSSLVYNWSFGDYTYSDTVGSTSHVYTYGGIYSVNLSITNANGTSYEYKQDYITVSQSPITVNNLYAHETRFTIYDKNGNPIPNLTVGWVMMNSSTDGTNWFSTLFNIPGTATPIESTAVTGFTDSAGNVIFPAVGSGLYAITGIDSTRGINFMKLVHPDQNIYSIYVETSQTTDVITPDASVNSSLFVNEIGGNIYLNMSYVDNTSRTTSVVYRVQYQNQTDMFTTTIVPSDGIANYSYTVPNIAGAGYVWSSAAYSYDFGWLNKSMGITTKGSTGLVYDPLKYRGRW